MILPSRKIFGLGERTGPFSLNEGTWTMWSKGGQGPAEEDDGSGGKQSYGVHPFALVRTAISSQFMGLFFRGSNAMSPVIRYTEDDKALLSYISTGGQVEIYFIMKGSAKDVIKRYQNLVGKPSLPPLWSLGWQMGGTAFESQSDYFDLIGYHDISRYPLETVWIDQKTYLHPTFDFYLDLTKFDSLNKFRQDLEGKHMKMIFTVRTGLRLESPDNSYWQTALQASALLKSSINPTEKYGLLAQNFQGDVTTFFDFFQPAAKDIWENGLNELYKWGNYDGLILSDNEVSGLCDGECPNGVVTQSQQAEKNQTEVFNIIKKTFHSFTALIGETLSSHGWWSSFGDQSEVSTFKLPFIPGNIDNLDQKSISLNATHPSTSQTQYDLHSLYGHHQSMITKQILAAKNDKRPFIQSRSTFAGTGQHASHWLGNSQKSWTAMKNSIAGVMNFNMFGIPHSGPDTCGTFGDTTDDELCARWIQLATFFPLARLNSPMENNSEKIMPFFFNEPYNIWAFNAMRDRFRYMRHMYTCLYEASVSGQTCFDPLLFHFPEIEELYDSDKVEQSFIVGDALKVSPVLEPGVTSTFKSYFPNQKNGTWVSMNNFGDRIYPDPTKEGEWVDLEAPNGFSHTIPVHLRPGYIVAVQDGTDHSTIMTTSDLLATGKLDLVVNRDQDGLAEGTVFLDIGETRSELENNLFEYYKFSLQSNSIFKRSLNTDAPGSTGTNLYKLVITNAPDLNDTNFACAKDTADTQLKLNYIYDNLTETFTLTNWITGSLIDLFALKSIHFGNSSRQVNPCDLESQFYMYKNKDQNNQSSPSEPQIQLLVESIADQVLKPLIIDVRMLNGGILNLNYNFQNVSGSEKMPFEVPEELTSINRSDINMSSSTSGYFQYLQYENEGIKINIFNGNRHVVWQLDGFIMADHMNFFFTKASYMQEAARPGILGLFGQQTDELYTVDGIYNFWARKGDVQNSKNSPGQSMVSVQPFYMAQANDGTWYGVYTNIAAAQEWTLKNDAPFSQVSINGKANGGVGDFYFMFGASPAEVIQKYHNLIGKPVRTPQWALGWHLVTGNLNGTQVMKGLVQEFIDNRIPLNGVWMDVEYMKDFKSFELDKNFTDIFDYVSWLHQKYLQFVPILTPSIAYVPGQNYPAFDSGQELDIFLKDRLEGDLVVGQGVPGQVVYPDFLNMNSTQVWIDSLLSYLHSMVNFDGIWVDMDEAITQCQGTECEYRITANVSFLPQSFDLGDGAIPLNAVHANNYTELDTHSLFGTAQAVQIDNFFKNNTDQRTAIFGRSSFAGFGGHASGLLGENESNIESMRNSVLGVMRSGIAGIPLSGADVCGFRGNTTAELCARWHVIAAFQPLSRNHNSPSSSPQLPMNFTTEIYEGNKSYFDIIQNAMRIKMDFLRYYHTSLDQISKNGGMLYQPMFFVFPDDDLAYANQSNNIMLGDALKLSVLSNSLDQNETDYYFPAGAWCDLFNQAGSSGCFSSDSGKNLTLPSKLYDFNVHLRAGRVIPFQNETTLRLGPYTNKLLNVQDFQMEHVSFYVFPECNKTACSASGLYVNDDGYWTNLTTRQNIYNLGYEQDLVNSAENLTVWLNMSEQATFYQYNVINSNDGLGGIEVYNASAMGLDSPSGYDARIYFETGLSAPVGQAQYDSTTDRLSYAYSGGINLAILSKVVFTKVK